MATFFQVTSDRPDNAPIYKSRYLPLMLLSTGNSPFLPVKKTPCHYQMGQGMIKWTNTWDRQQKRDFPITSGRSCAGRIHANKSDMENMRIYIPTTLPLSPTWLLYCLAMLLTLPRTDDNKLLHTTNRLIW
jgi:hypothetical protein